MQSNVSMVTRRSKCLVSRLSSSNQQGPPYWSPSHLPPSLSCYIQLKIYQCASLCISSQHSGILHSFSDAVVNSHLFFPPFQNTFSSCPTPPACTFTGPSFAFQFFPANYNVASSRKSSFSDCLEDVTSFVTCSHGSLPPPKGRHSWNKPQSG